MTEGIHTIAASFPREYVSPAKENIQIENRAESNTGNDTNAVAYAMGTTPASQRSVASGKVPQRLNACPTRKIDAPYRRLQRSAIACQVFR